MNDAAFLLRPARLADLDALVRFAQASTFGIHTLKPGREHLRERIERSQRAFAASELASGDEIYHFVLEDLATGRVVGTSGLVANAGAEGRFFSWRNEFTVHASEELGIVNRVHTLRLCEDLSGHSLLSSFYIEPEYAETAAPQLLSRGRLLFVKQHAARFAERIAAENPGLCDAEGRSPVWEALGRRFFMMAFPEAELRTRGRSKSFIADLLPRSPVYVPLLTEEAQWALGQLHPDGELPFSILIDEGFDADSHVDVFDGGPIAEARTAMLRSVVGAHALPAHLQTEAPADGWHLLANTHCAEFRAVLAPAQASERQLGLSAQVAARLGVGEGGTVLTLALEAAD